MWSSKSIASSQDPLSMTGVERAGTGTVRAEGDKELVLEEGESSLDDPPPDCIRIALDAMSASNCLGLSFPVGPFPRGALVDGGRLNACRR